MVTQLVYVTLLDTQKQYVCVLLHVEGKNAEKVQFCLQHNSIMLFTKVGQLLTAPALHLDQVSLNTCTLQFELCGEGALHMNAM